MNSECDSCDHFDVELAALFQERSLDGPEKLLHFLHGQYELLSQEKDSFAGYHVLAEASFLLWEHQRRPAWTRPVAWQFYRELTIRAWQQNDDKLKERIIIALFEVIAEPPWFPRDVELLFSLLDDPSTRWAVFEAYRHYPRSLGRHIPLYAAGRITDAEYTDWLHGKGLVQTKLGLRFMAKRSSNGRRAFISRQ